LHDRDSGAQGFGEVAPLPEFGSESLDDALARLASLPTDIRRDALKQAIRDAPPATAFGLWSALDAMAPAQPPPAAVSASLLALDDAAPRRIAAARADGAGVFKLKLGRNDPRREWRLLRQLAAQLLPDERLRLDPNRAWSTGDGVFWRERLGDLTQVVEFVEEPFAAGLFDRAALCEEARRWPVPLALDEQLNGPGLRGWTRLEWPGYWIIKPSLSGDPRLWVPQLAIHKDRVVLSSAFETGVGLTALLRLAQSFDGCVHGLGTQAWFDDGWRAPPQGCRVGPLAATAIESLWRSLSSN
jgi:O-succinylbenzoate synthase